MAGTGIIDSHVHLLPGRIGEKVRGIFEAGEAAGRFVLAYPSDHSEVVASLRGEGVVGAWSLPYAHKPGVADGLNEASALIAERHSGEGFTVTGGATVHPGDDDPAGVVERAVSLHGLKVLKLHCSVGGFGVDDPALAPALAAAARHRMPTVVHLGHSSDGLTEEHEPMHRTPLYLSPRTSRGSTGSVSMMPSRQQSPERTHGDSSLRSSADRPGYFAEFFAILKSVTARISTPPAAE
mgnify:CR=1 FL=1